jgi:cytoskeletal protein CcmA (bactofilin family)
MKTRLLILLCLLWLPAAAQAYQWRVGDRTNALELAAGERLDDEAVLAAYSLNVQGQAARDLWLLASTSVRFDGQSEGDLRVLASSAVLGGEARQNLLAYAPGLQLTSNAVVRGQAALFGTTVICEGQVEGDAWIVANSVTLGGRWAGNVRVQAVDIRVVPGTTIAGDLVYTSPKTLVYDSSVAIAGTVKQTKNLLPETSLQTNFFIHGYLFVAALLVGMPFVGFFPGLAGGAVRKLRTSPWRVLAAGAGTVLLGPFLIAFAFMTLVGLPLALLLGALYVALAYLSHVVIALWLGHRLLRAPGPQTMARVLSALATGLFLLYFVTALPGLAAFVVLPVIVLGTGALMLALLQRPLVSFPLPPPPPLPRPPETTPENQE